MYTHQNAVFNRRTAILSRHFSSAATLLTILGSALIFFTGDWNADWASYNIIYDYKGAWLGENNRDAGFLWLSETIRRFGGYSDFRLWIGLYFFFFMLWFVNHWHRMAVIDRHLLSYVPLLPLVISRFTVQIREGIAITFVMIGLTIMMHERRRSLFWALVWFALASSVHQATAVFIPLLVIPWMMRLAGTYVKVARFALTSLALGILGMAVASGLIEQLLGAIGASLYSDLVPIYAENNIEKLAYWVLRTLIVIYIIIQAKEAAQKHPAAIAGFLRATSYVALPLTTLGALILIIGEHNAYVASASARMLTTLCTMALAITALRIPKTIGILIVSVFDVTDQIRILIVNAPLDK